MSSWLGVLLFCWFVTGFFPFGAMLGNRLTHGRWAVRLTPAERLTELERKRRELDQRIAYTQDRAAAASPEDQR